MRYAVGTKSPIQGAEKQDSMNNIRTNKVTKVIVKRADKAPAILWLDILLSESLKSCLSRQLTWRPLF